MLLSDPPEEIGKEYLNPYEENANENIGKCKEN